MKKTILITSALFMASFAYGVDGSISTKGQKKADYHKLATVSLQDAVGAALAKAPGKAVEAELDDEKGFLVYEIKVIGDDNTKHELTVDAGNQAILREKTKK